MSQEISFHEVNYCRLFGFLAGACRSIICGAHRLHSKYCLYEALGIFCRRCKLCFSFCLVVCNEFKTIRYFIDVLHYHSQFHVIYHRFLNGVEGISNPFHICTSYPATSEGVSRVTFVSKFKNLKFWQIL